MTDTVLEQALEDVAVVDVRPREPISQGNPVLVQTGVGGPEWRCWTWCPACLAVHQWPVEDDDPQGPRWNGDPGQPTFNGSSLSVTWQLEDDSTYRCDAHLRAGAWEFTTDCTHDLAGQTVPMVPVPDWMLPDLLLDDA